MPAVLLSPIGMITQLLTDQGVVGLGFKINTYVGGTVSTPQTTYTDSTGTVTNTNPIVLGSNGRFQSVSVWAVPGTLIKMVITDSLNNLIAGGTIDNIPLINDVNVNSFTAAGIGAILYPQTAAELAASVTPTNYVYPALNVKRYGAIGNGVTDDRAAIKTAWTVAVQAGGGRIVFPDGATYAVNSLDPLSPLSLPSQNSDGSMGSQSYQMALYFKNGNNIDFDFLGSTLTTNITGGGNFILFDHCTKCRLIAPKITGVQVMSTGVVTLGAITGGAGYINGSYTNVPLTGGTGGGSAVANITVAGGTVTAVTIAYVGGNYTLNDVLSASNANLGGAGAGFSVPVTSVTGAGPVVSVASPNAVVVCAVNGSSSEIDTVDLNVTAMYSAFWMIANPTNTPQNTVTHCHLRGLTTFRNGTYGVAMHNAGDNSVVDNLYAYRDDRGFFLYGVQNVTFGQVTVDQLGFGFQSLIKAYSRSTLGVTIGQYSTINQPGQSTVVGRIAIQVQCDPAVINPPPTVQNVFINSYHERNITAGQIIEFDYFAGAGGLVLTATSANQLFNNIILKGSSAGILFTNVALTTAAAACLCDFDQMVYFQPAAANSVDAGNGFVKARLFGFTPVLTFGGANVGMTTSVANCEYYIRNGILYFNLDITLTAKGSSVGAAAITLPFVPRRDEGRNPLVFGLADNMAALGGNVIGVIPTSGVANFTLFTQGAAGSTFLADTNFTNTSHLRMSGNYPV